MNKYILEKLWAEVNRMHGVLTMPEACRLIIYALFLKYLDMNHEMVPEVYDEKFSVRYLARIYGELVKPEDVAGYVKKIEPDLMPGDGIVAEGLSGLLEKAEDSHVQMVFRAVEEMDVESRQLYEAAVSLLDTLAFTYNNMMGDASPNLSLSRLEGKLLGCREGMRVYDGFCGYGLSVNEAAGGRGDVCLQDTDRESAAIAAVLAVLKGNKVEAVRCGDSLADPLGGGKYDRIIIEPPISPQYDDNYVLSIPDGNCIYPESGDNGSLALRHALAHLDDDGIAVVLVPAGMLFKSGKAATVRENLVSEWLDAVIELPSGVIPNTWVATALLVLKKKRTHDTIFMANATAYFEKTGRNRLKISDENISRLVGLYERREELDSVSCVKQEKDIKEKGCNLCTSQYVISDPQSTIVTEDAASYLEEYTQLAGELAELDRQLNAIRGRFI